ncbi:MAG: hypothetical protein NTV62_01575, partial [Candidatus Gribaldobacteria bacterium]|nr:hypothetical protein [Candidatus Gribaldobacteria bacterium]
IIVSNDADNKGVSPKYLENFIDKFEENPKADGFSGQLDWDTEAYTKYPLVHIGTRLFQYLDIETRHQTGHIPTPGANFAFRSSIYSAVGGYIEDTNLAEDVVLGQAILDARKSRKAVQFA